MRATYLRLSRARPLRRVIPVLGLGAEISVRYFHGGWFAQGDAMARWVVGLWLLVFASGCFSVGSPFPTHKVSKIQIGKTTQDQIRADFGAPWRTGLEDGEDTWTYGRYVYGLGVPARTADLKVRFDRRGIVTSYTFSSTDPGP